MFALLFCIFFHNSSFAQDSQIPYFIQKAQDLKLAQSREWKKLLHLEKGFWGQEQSEIDDPNFLLNSKQTDPELELKLFIEQTFSQNAQSNIPESERLSCRFPARNWYIQRSLSQYIDSNHSWPKQSCPHFESWFENIHAESVSLIFSSYFLNNPSSSFGHTLLRINQSKKVQHSSLIDYGFNYAAIPTTQNPVLYSFMGLFGGFHGGFTALPYYYKVREYNHAESRDLWEYNLSLTPQESQQLVRHFWEVANSYANYWYLSKNCSYHMLTVLEAAAPRFHLLERLKKFVIPTDTIQLAYETPELVTNIHYRPSVRTQFFESIKDLNSIEKQDIFVIANQLSEIKLNETLLTLEENRKPKVLDALIDLMDFQYSHDIQIQESKPAQFKQIVLLKRSQMESITPENKILMPILESPHLGHPSRKISLGFGSQTQDLNSLWFNYKFALHDFIDDPVGYPNYAMIHFFDIHFSYLENLQKLQFEKWTLFEVHSLSHYQLFNLKPSWHLHFGFDRDLWSRAENTCLDCIDASISGGIGINKKYGSLNAGIYFKSSLASNILTSDNFSTFSKSHFLMGPQFFVKFQFGEKLISTIDLWESFKVNNSFKDEFMIQIQSQYNFNRQWGIKWNYLNQSSEFKNFLSLAYLY